MATKFIDPNNQSSDISELNYDSKVKEILEGFPDYTFSFFNNMSARKNRPKSIVAYAIDIRVFYNFLIQVNPTLKNYSNITADILSSLTDQDIDEYIKYLTSYDTGKTTKDGQNIVMQNGDQAIRRKISSLRTYFNYLESHKIVTFNPLTSYSQGKIKRDKKPALNSSEVNSILESMKNMTALSENKQKYAERTYYRDIAIMTTFLYTGIRVSELVNLDLSDIKESDMTLHVERKGGKNEDVLMNDEVYEALCDYIELERYSEDGSQQAVFLSSRRGENNRLSVKSCERIVTKYSKNFTQKHVTPHTLRRTFGTTLYNKYGDPYLVQNALGHQDISTTVNYYTHMDEERAEKIRNIRY